MWHIISGVIVMRKLRKQGLAREALFDLSDDGTGTEGFFNFPYPSELRLDEAGRPDLQGFPNPNLAAVD